MARPDLLCSVNVVAVDADINPNEYVRGKSVSNHLFAANMNDVTNSWPWVGEIMKEPKDGGAFVVTRIEAVDSPHFNENSNDEPDVSELGANTRFND